ncbi:hypothetical protein ACE6HT_13185 [Citrobacter freundii]|uniref:hypothetical protein n=1 Tax=Citrobacter freundii TaxID=546 RepID=UPI0035D02AC0
MMKIIIIALATLASSSAFAQCVGTRAVSTCFDDNGNSYQVNRMGNSTFVQGRNAQTGSTWSQNSQSFGNQTTTTGRASNGQTWNETQTNLGGGNRMVSGRNSQGQSYSYSCNQFGCN